MTDIITPPGSKSEQAYAAVKARIIEQDVLPGYRLVLGKIAEDLGVSVVPVREAIRRLEAEGLVTFERNCRRHGCRDRSPPNTYTMQTLEHVIEVPPPPCPHR